MAVYNGGTGSNIYHGTDADDTIRGGGGDDVLSGGNGNDLVDGEDGNDVLSGDDGTNDLRGGAGMDLITSYGFGDTIDAGLDDDLVFIRGTIGGAEAGGEGLDELTFENATFGPGSGSATWSGFERISGNLTGTDGDDNLDLTTLSGVEYETGITMEIRGGAGADSIVSPGEVRQLISGGSGDDVIRSAGKYSSFFGDEGHDVIVSLGESARIQGGTGNDRIETHEGEAYGDDGNDVIKMAGGVGWAYGGNGHDRLEGGSEWQRLFGESGNDILLGRGGGDRLDGGDGRDALYGHEGEDFLSVPIDAANDHDVLMGGADRDAITGGYGDTIDGGDGNDRLALDLSHSPGAITAHFDSLLDGSSWSFGGRTISGIEILSELIATPFADELSFEVRVSSLHAGAGNDRISGSALGSKFDGQEGNDVLVGGAAQTL